MTRFLLAAVALAVAVAPAAYATPEVCAAGFCVDTCEACIGPLPDPCDIVRCTPPCILGVTC